MTDLLRGELGFIGLAVSDSMAMQAISDNFGQGEAIILAFLAGCDTIIAPPEWEVWNTLSEAVKSGRIPMSRLDEAVDRVLAVKNWVFADGYQQPKAEDVAPVFESVQTAKTLEALAQKSTTIIEGSALPLSPGAKKRLVIIQERDETYQYCIWEKAVLDKAERTLRQAEPDAAVLRISMACSDDEARAVRQAAADCEEVIFFCIAKHLIEQYDGRLSPASAELLSGISRERSVIGICLGSPYVIEDIAECVGFICTYSESDISAETALKVLYGEVVPAGKLPVTISEKYPAGTG